MEERNKEINKEIKFTFNKSERLRHKSLVDALFAEGEHITVFPMRLTWRALDDAALSANFRDHVPQGIGKVQLMITVPKKKLRHAVDRVAMRRRIREAWRLQRLPLKELAASIPGIRTLSVAIVYLANERDDMERISLRMEKLLARFGARLQEKFQENFEENAHDEPQEAPFPSTQAPRQ